MQKIDAAVLDKLAVYLDEPSRMLRLALEWASDHFVRGLIEIAQTVRGAKSILQVIEDGGHTGSLLNNLHNIAEQDEKLDLLVSIGRNINSYFLGSRFKERIHFLESNFGFGAEQAEALQNLASPLVLGVIGKERMLKNFGPIELASFLRAQEKVEELDVNLPVHTSVLTGEEIEKTEEEPLVFPVRKRSKKKKKKGEPEPDRLTWVLLALVLAGAVYFAFRDRMAEDKGLGAIAHVPDRETHVLDKIERLPENKTEEPENSEVYPPDEKAAVPEKATVPEKNNPATSNVPKPVAEKPKVQNPKAYVPAVRNTEPESDDPNKTTDNRPMAEKLANAGASFGVSGLNFKSESAEIDRIGQVAELVRYLNKNPSNKIEIKGVGSNSQLANDRAYALRYELFALGIPVSRIEISSPKMLGDNPIEVRIK